MGNGYVFGRLFCVRRSCPRRRNHLRGWNCDHRNAGGPYQLHRFNAKRRDHARLGVLAWKFCLHLAVAVPPQASSPMRKITSLLLLAFLITACKSGEGSGVAYSGPVASANWATSATAYRGDDGLLVAFQCTPNANQSDVRPVWGTSVYSDDSSVCSAGVHAGAITFKDGGVVVFEIMPGQEGYEASEQNGVVSSPWGSWSGSFRIVQ